MTDVGAEKIMVGFRFETVTGWLAERRTTRASR